MSISVKDIFKLDSLKKLNLLAGEAGLEKGIEWIYVAECFENPLDGIKWLQGGEIIFITGVGIKNNMDMLIKLIEGISEKNGSGLIVNIGPYINEVSEEVIKIADKLELPLFTLPWEVKLVEVSREISNAIVLSRIEENSLTHFLSNILFGDGELEGDAIEKAAYFGYNLAGECCICVIDIDGFERYLKLKKLEDEISISRIKITFRKIVQDILEKHALKVPIIDKDDAVILFNRSEENCMKRLQNALKEIQEVIKRRIDGLSVSVGIGNPYRDLKMMKQSLNEAELAIDSAKCQGLDDTITQYKDIGIYGLLFNIKNKNVLENYYLDALGSISNSDDKNKDGNLLKILETYLNENCSITVTAEKLFLHRNTLKYKIKKIEELLECDLHNFDDCMKIKIALYINKILK
ncbi:PucR family transcriptional regulator [Clostridium saccharobutylicum]|uniref:Regulator of polyketide synthase expression n=1 Tax=Clostridium saccharobutylicum DSM 13864 TaxID=1345695 RepID=U5MMU8_CLOSA|nr:PucR family transcriptional regulator [Clostridium saccharobutylicum]AGX41875.1 regulator of polyketide synthase expression [Clostridium saccharobutylicum DSM 13864]AQR89149.1 purine catabolism regulatory protein [Clostridium saccharobutylicum]AQR99050.1 purine catabolism regulatory protein [Clostridium saccharobutylicum]AQS13038.1 purine catabolism regulatory protein [Clostridium saccharobutylicum]MBA2903841.1 sugar diacid utilization regulator [Clostridium saccharobutylicum]